MSAVAPDEVWRRHRLVVRQLDVNTRVGLGEPCYLEWPSMVLPSSCHSVFSRYLATGLIANFRSKLARSSSGCRAAPVAAARMINGHALGYKDAARRRRRGSGPGISRMRILDCQADRLGVRSPANPGIGN